MEVPSEATGIFSIKPPSLEDAGLEDTALSPDGIQEAFRLAAQKMKFTAKGVLGSLGLQEDGCTESLEPGYTDWELVQGGDEEDAKPGSCVETETGGLIEEGRDRVVDTSPTGEDRILTGDEAGPRLGETGCVKDTTEDEPASKKPSEEDKEKADNGPGLTKAAI